MDLPARLFLAKSLGHGHTPDLTGGSLPVTGLYLILRRYLPSGAAAKPAREDKQRRELMSFKVVYGLEGNLFLNPFLFCGPWQAQILKIMFFDEG